MLMPRKTKYRNQHKNRIKGQSKRAFTIAFGSYALIALSSGYMSSKQIESARVAINRFVKKTGKVWIRVFPDKPLTKKPAEIRMGKGKGAIDQWVAVIKPGRVLYEIDGVNMSIAQKAMKMAQAKLSISTKIIIKAQEFLF